MVWVQHELTLPAFQRGCHLVTQHVVREIQDSLSGVRVGLAHIFNPDVRADMETFLNKVVPEGLGAPWIHTDEGPDDMPAHCKASMMGSSVSVPITNGRLNMGTWQGIWLCEHRDRGGRRRVVVTIQGE